MGPRSADRGNASLERGKQAANELQWGRDQQIAEIWPVKWERESWNCFNGAAISRSRK